MHWIGYSVPLNALQPYSQTHVSAIEVPEFWKRLAGGRSRQQQHHRCASCIQIKVINHALHELSLFPHFHSTSFSTLSLSLSTMPLYMFSRRRSCFVALTQFPAYNIVGYDFTPSSSFTSSDSLDCRTAWVVVRLPFLYEKLTLLLCYITIYTSIIHGECI